MPLDPALPIQRSRLLGVLKTTLALLALAAFLFVGWVEWSVGHAAQARIGHSADDAGEQDVAVLLGDAASPSPLPGVFSPAPILLTARLWQLGKVRAVLVSGPRPEAVKRDLVEAGLPPEFISCDAGPTDVADVLARAKRVFGLDSVLLLAPHGPLERALYFADALGLQAGGLATQPAPVPWPARGRRFLHETWARIQAWLQVQRGRLPQPSAPPLRVPLASRLA